MIRFTSAITTTLLVAVASAWSPASAQSATLDFIRDRGAVRCGVSTNQVGMGVQSESGTWHGMDMDLCRAIAAATLGNADAVEYVAIDSRNRFPVLQSGEIDVLIRSTASTFDRDTTHGIDFVSSFFIAMGTVMVPVESGVTHFADLDGLSVCYAVGSLQETELDDMQARTGITITKVPVHDWDDSISTYLSGGCLGLANPRSALLAMRATMPDPGAHRLLEDPMSIGGLGLIVRHGDNRWEDIIRWTFNALLAAEQYGITQVNAQRLSEESRHPAVRRLIGAESTVGEAMGLDADWALRAIQAAGNYSEIYDRHFGPNSELPIPRERNRLWRDGGMMIVLPFE